MQHNTFQDKLATFKKIRPDAITEHEKAEIKALRSYFQPYELEAFGIETDEKPKKSKKDAEQE